MTQTEEKSKGKMPRSKKFRLTNLGQDVIVFIDKGKTFTTSLVVAEKFGKRHDNVVQTIRNLNDHSDNFWLLNFKERKYIDDRGKEQPMFELTKDGFVFLVMRFTGKEAMTWQKKFIAAFNHMERLLHQRSIDKNDTSTLIARYEGKVSRAFDTDITKTHQPYAKTQGSTEKLKTRIINQTRTVYSYLYYDYKWGMPLPDNHRDLMPREVLMQCKRLEDAQALMTIEGEAKGLNYKDIKKNQKSAMAVLAERFGRFSIKDVLTQVSI
ncbi:Phage regulatory protein, Rha [Candidatus Magnetobacterium bavaricum]|uniref:Phage regulatory protein, Rha n=1 Tax=Candidatus Magnetobacterium bavaricum TaxID=29290 RepID=A0A0F3GMG5_9BACT|nr:Phage regulatory protein, Rha [Candidatus Magnetobacterium bavaricum]